MSRIVSLKFLLIFIAIPMFIGGMIYILFRPESLLMFKWFNYLDLTSLITKLRGNFSFLGSYLPGWVVYSLPDGIWVFSLTAVMFKIWQNGALLSRLFWCSIGPILGVGGEIGQYFSVVPGTFDIADLVINVVSSLLAFYFVKISNRGDCENEF